MKQLLLSALVVVAACDGSVRGSQDQDGDSALPATDDDVATDNDVATDDDTAPLPGDIDVDPEFPVGDVTLVLDGPMLSVHAERTVTTAAGVYTNDHRLVRTLWRSRRIEAGAETSITWDYNDDTGAQVGDGAYEVTVIAHNVEYDWQGVVGNTSNPGNTGIVPGTFAGIPVSTVGEHLHRAFHPITMMAISGDIAFTATGFNEQQHAMARFALSQPQKRTVLAHDDFQRVYEHVATDGVIAYYVNSGLFGDNDIFYHPENFIVGIRVSDNTEVDFPSGAPWTDGIGEGNHWRSVIDVVEDGVDQIRGIAVGDVLYVAHAASGVKIFDKTSGACMNCANPLGVPSPSALAVGPDGALWVVSNGTEVRRYVNGNATLTISGLEKAVALGVSPQSNTLVVLDAGANEQRLKAYDTASGTLKWTHGQRGGYDAINGPEVRPDKLRFGDINVGYVAFEPVVDGVERFWVGEPGNLRNLELEIPASPASENPLILRNIIMFVPASYTATADKADPTRIFNGFMEFAVDYSKPLQQAWTLVRNWDTGLPSSYFTRLQAGFRDVCTVQGHTYATILGLGAETNIVLELAPAGVRETGLTLQSGARMHENGTVRYGVKTEDAYVIYERILTAIDGSNNPVFGEPQVIASVPRSTPAFHGPCAVDPQEPTFPVTSTNVIVTFDPCAFAEDGYDPQGFHLGGVQRGATSYAFRTSPGGAFTLLQDLFVVDGDGVFNLERLQENYAGSVAMTAGRHIVYNYFGEFWNNGQANQWMHWLDNGLFVGQFGTPSYPSSNKLAPLVGSAGNTFSPTLVTVGDNIYVYHNDESVHGGVHRWRLKNLGSIQKMVGNVGKGVSVDNPATIVSERY